jgi:transposase-like protein
MNEALRKVLKRLHYPLEVMLTCVRWYVATPVNMQQGNAILNQGSSPIAFMEARR